MNAAPALSRRQLFARFLERAQSSWKLASPPAASSAPAQPQVAVVQGRFCLAFQHSFCSTCVERCPVPGAVVVERHVPRIVADLCTGCGICQEVCPAPRNAILMINRQRVTSPQL